MSRRGLIRGERRHQVEVTRYKRTDPEYNRCGHVNDRMVEKSVTASQALGKLLPLAGFECRRSRHRSYRGTCSACGQRGPVLGYVPRCVYCRGSWCFRD